MSGRGRAAGAAGLVAVLAACAWLALRPGSGSASGSGGSTSIARETAEVRRTTLVEREELDGTLGYGRARSVGGMRAGTVTAAPAVGSVVDRGGVLWEVEQQPVRLLFGDRPAWRALAAGVEDGPDVRQLEENLVAMGHATSATLTVDDRWTSATTAAVKRWQKASGTDQTGAVESGDVVFLPGAVRVAGHEAEVGQAAQPGSPVLSVTGNALVVTVELDASERDLLAVGGGVEVVLPGGSTVAGTVAEVGTTATGGDSGDEPGGGDQGGDDATVEAVVTLGGADTGGLDGAPVTVRAERRKAESVLAVPVNALLALAEGGYAVELVGGRLVGVETGLFADGLVEVRGDGLSEGDRVVVPA